MKVFLSSDFSRSDMTVEMFFSMRNQRFGPHSNHLCLLKPALKPSLESVSELNISFPLLCFSADRLRGTASSYDVI